MTEEQDDDAEFEPLPGDAQLTDVRYGLAKWMPGRRYLGQERQQPSLRYLARTYGARTPGGFGVYSLEEAPGRAVTRTSPVYAFQLRHLLQERYEAIQAGRIPEEDDPGIDPTGLILVRIKVEAEIM